MRLIFTILLFISFGLKAQIVRCNPFYKPTNSYFLDLYPSATLAVSLRKLSSSYSANCIRVRRSSDNTEQDIGFSSNYLDTASMKTFVGANNGFVVTWYDQSGNSNNVSQSTAASQPKIITSGVINRQNGIACINTATSLSLKTSGVLFNTNTNITFIAAIGSHTSANTGFFGNRPATINQGWIYDWRTTNNYIYTNVGFITTVYASTGLSKHIAFLAKKGTTTTIAMWINSTAAGTPSGGYSYGSSSAAFYIGVDGNGGSNFFANANFYEVIGYITDKTSTRTLMESNVNNYYSIY